MKETQLHQSPYIESVKNSSNIILSAEQTVDMTMIWDTMWRHTFMMTSSYGNIFHVTGQMCGEFTGHRWIPRTKASDAELGCFLWYAPE